MKIPNGRFGGQRRATLLIKPPILPAITIVKKQVKINSLNPKSENPIFGLRKFKMLQIIQSHSCPSVLFIHSLAYYRFIVLQLWSGSCLHAPLNL